MHTRRMRQFGTVIALLVATLLIGSATQPASTVKASDNSVPASTVNVYSSMGVKNGQYFEVSKRTLIFTEAPQMYQDRLVHEFGDGNKIPFNYFVKLTRENRLWFQLVIPRVPAFTIPYDFWPRGSCLELTGDADAFCTGDQKFAYYPGGPGFDFGLHIGQLHVSPRNGGPAFEFNDIYPDQQTYEVLPDGKKLFKGWLETGEVDGVRWMRLSTARIVDELTQSDIRINVLEWAVVCQKCPPPTIPRPRWQ